MSLNRWGWLALVQELIMRLLLLKRKNGDDDELS